MNRKLLVLVVAVLMATVVQARELTWSYVVPAVANKEGAQGTDWHTDLTIYNPQDYNLPLVIQFLQAGRDNSSGVPTIDNFEIFPWETLSLWDVLGPDGFDKRGQTGSLLVFVDDLKRTCTGHECDIAVFARTYTLNPNGSSGEFGQAIPGCPTNLGLDRSVIAFMPQLMDDSDFRTNAGVVSLTNAVVTVRFELQDKDGKVILRVDKVLLPYGHTQWGLNKTVTGGTLAAFILAGPNDAMVMPYASVVNNATGDPVNIEAHMTPVGAPAQGLAVQGVSSRTAGSFPARQPVAGVEMVRQQRAPLR
ncbi:MAG: hypothetical protein MUF10_04285 [Thermoanaerobaculaceae bacterium]|jgi:hypothetical protein|nr:hypothetical protein [Thermoanaerobaculaceae bacterium]